MSDKEVFSFNDSSGVTQVGYLKWIDSFRYISHTDIETYQFAVHYVTSKSDEVKTGKFMYNSFTPSCFKSIKAHLETNCIHIPDKVKLALEIPIEHPEKATEDIEKTISEIKAKIKVCVEKSEKGRLLRASIREKISEYRSSDLAASSENERLLMEGNLDKLLDYLKKVKESNEASEEELDDLYMALTDAERKLQKTPVKRSFTSTGSSPSRKVQLISSNSV